MAVSKKRFKLPPRNRPVAATAPAANNGQFTDARRLILGAIAVVALTLLLSSFGLRLAGLRGTRGRSSRSGPGLIMPTDPPAETSDTGTSGPSRSASGTIETDMLGQSQPSSETTKTDELRQSQSTSGTTETDKLEQSRTSREAAVNKIENLGQSQLSRENADTKTSKQGPSWPLRVANKTGRLGKSWPSSVNETSLTRQRRKVTPLMTLIRRFRRAANRKFVLQKAAGASSAKNDSSYVVKHRAARDFKSFFRLKGIFLYYIDIYLKEELEAFGLCWTWSSTCFASYDTVALFNIAIMDQCSFTRGYEWDVPVMLTTSFGGFSAAFWYPDYLGKLSEWMPCISCLRYERNLGSPMCVPGNQCPKKYKNKLFRKHVLSAQHNYAVMNVHHQFYRYDQLYNGRYNSLLTEFLKRECNKFFRNGQYPVMNDVVKAYVAIYAIYSRCLMGLTRYCPNPCRNPSACSKENMISSCHPVRKEGNRFQVKLDTRYFSGFREVFAFVPYCACVNGFTYNLDTEECEPIPFKCGTGSCLHNGICETVPSHMVEILGREFDCVCKPAWQGLRCEEIRDPCRYPDNRDSCGEFECRRSPADEQYGFECICPTGYSLTRQLGRPKCRDINECAVTMPCKNGGNCINTEGSFECQCRRQFSGRYCEIPPPEPHWLAWSAWSVCSTTCSVGLQHRHRNCSLEGSCSGLQKDFRTCMGRQLDCTHSQVGEVSPEEQAGGAGWRAEEDKVLDDAWYFREFQLLRLGLNSRALPEDELLLGWDDILYKYILYLYIAALVEGLILLALCRRVRRRVRP